VTAPAPAAARPAVPRRLLPGASAAPALRLLERNVTAWRGVWVVFLSVLLEPLLFLLSIGVGVGALVGDVTLADGSTVSYREFVAAGMLAASAMFGPVFDTTFNFFVKLKYVHLYDGVLATPLRPVDVVRGELAWAVLRGSVYALAFVATMVVMGLVRSWWAVLTVPVAALIGYAFGGAGLAVGTLMRSFIDFDWVNIALQPLFLFSATFFPLARYPEAVQRLVQVTPLYQGVLLERSLILGQVSWALVVPAAYLAVMGTVGLRVAGRRMATALQP
jgi:lipooligosaccharide transport system permease protein